MSMKEPMHEPNKSIPGCVSDAKETAAHASIAGTVTTSKDTTDAPLPGTILKKGS